MRQTACARRLPTDMIGGGTWEGAHARHEATGVRHPARRRGGGWPLAARAQQPGKIARVSVLMGYAKGDPEAEGWVRGLIQGLHELRWAEGSNIQMEYRWP